MHADIIPSHSPFLTTHLPSCLFHQVEEGWCKGVLNGVKGMFPDNFVNLLPASKSKSPLLQQQIFHLH